MKHGHSTGTRREQPNSQDWYAARQAELLAAIEQAWPAQPTQKQLGPARARLRPAPEHRQLGRRRESRMTLMLSAEASREWDCGGWLSLEIQESVLEDIERQQITEAVHILLYDGRTAFAVSAGGIL